MTDQARLERSQLKNAHVFVGKFTDLICDASIALCDAGVDLENAEAMTAHNEKMEAAVDELIARYPNQLKGIAHDFVFYSEMLKRLRTILAHYAVEDILTTIEKKAAEHDVAHELDKMLGFRK
jgi:hypothetical protein